jgi:hypothetical protein
MTDEEQQSYLGAISWLRSSATDIEKAADMCNAEGSVGYQRLVPFLRAQARQFQARADALAAELRVKSKTARANDPSTR